MKKLLVSIAAALLFFCSGAYAQTDSLRSIVEIRHEKKMKEVQFYLRQANRNANASYITAIAGLGFMLVPSLSDDVNKDFYIGAGIGLSIISIITGKAAWSSVGKAGKVGWQPYYYEPVPDDGWEPEDTGDLSNLIKKK